MKRIYQRVSNKPLPNDAKGPLPVDVRRSTTLLLKLSPNSNPSKRGLSAGVISEKISILGQFLQEVSVGLILFIGSLVSAL